MKKNNISKTEELQVTCCICGSSQTQFFMSKNGIPLVRCTNDGMIFLKSRLKDEQLIDIYDSRYFTNDDNYSAVGANYLRDFPQMKYNSLLRLQRISKFKKINNSNLLDIGCAAGAFVESAQEYGCEAYGIDISKFAIDFAKSRGLKVYQGIGPEIVKENSLWDVITLWHVLEHVPDPKGLMTKVRSFMKSGSLLVVEIPNVDSLPAKLLGPKWKMISTNEHIWYFSEKTLSLLLTSCGFKVINVNRTSFTNLLSGLKVVGANPIISFIQNNLSRLGWLKKYVSYVKSIAQLDDCINVYAQVE